MGSLGCLLPIGGCDGNHSDHVPFCAARSVSSICPTTSELTAEGTHNRDAGGAASRRSMPCRVMGTGSRRPTAVSSSQAIRALRRTIKACDGCDVLVHEAQMLELYAKMPERLHSFVTKYHTTTEQLAVLATEAKPNKSRSTGIRGAQASVLHMLIKKLKYVGLPRGDIFVQVVMPVV